VDGRVSTPVVFGEGPPGWRASPVGAAIFAGANHCVCAAAARVAGVVPVSATDVAQASRPCRGEALPRLGQRPASRWKSRNAGKRALRYFSLSQTSRAVSAPPARDSRALTPVAPRRLQRLVSQLAPTAREPHLRPSNSANHAERTCPDNRKVPEGIAPHTGEQADLPPTSAPLRRI